MIAMPGSFAMDEMRIIIMHNNILKQLVSKIYISNNKKISNL